MFNRSALAWLASGDRIDREAAARLGRVLRNKYHDCWLADVLGEIRRGQISARSVRALKDAAEANARGDPESALREMEKVEIGRAGTAFRLRMDFERAYAMHRSLRTRECLDAAERLTEELSNKLYPWLKGGAEIEHATCAGLLGREGQALSELRQDEQELRQLGFLDLRLRAEGIGADVQTMAGNPWAVWPTAEDVLSEWWSSTAAPNRAQQVLFDLSQASEYLDYPYAAYAFGREAADAMVETPNRLTEALTRMHAAALAEAAGLHEEAMQQLRRSRDLFGRVPESAVTFKYRLDADVAVAGAQLAKGDARQALEQLEESKRQSAEAPTFQIEFQRAAIAGIAYADRKDTAHAEQALHEAIQLESARLQSLPEKRERLAAVSESAPVFHSLVKLLLTQKHDPRAAYGTWVEFLSAGEQESIEKPEKPLLPASGTWVGYVRLDDRYMMWLATREGVRWLRVQASAQEIDESVRRLLSFAADPISNTSTMEREATWLYEQLIGPGRGFMRVNEALVMVPDGRLTELPFHLLQNLDGRCLGDEYAISVASALRRADTEPALIRARTTALIVAQPSVGKSLAQRFAYLPDSAAEAESVRKYFPVSVLLTGADATLQRIEEMNPMPEVFHFSGHGFSNGGHGALVLAGDSIRSPSFLTPERISGMNFRGCRLAVLSACLTATGERQGPSNPESLVHALLMAGAREVVASRWSVDSSATRQLMERFYAELAAGATTPQALRVAANAVRRQPGHEHPYYWAAFQVFN